MRPTSIITRTTLRLVLSTLVVVASLLGFAAQAHAERKVFLNGIDLKDVDVKGHSFEGCTVRFDEQGNVHITVKGLQIGTTQDAGKEADKDMEKKPDGQQGAGETTGGVHYFLVVKPVRERGDAYKLSVYVNGVLFKQLGGTANMQVHDVTRQIKRGERNEIRVVENLDAAKAGSAGPSDDLEIVLGAGAIEEGVVTIDKPHMQHVRKKGDTGQREAKYAFAAD